MTWLICILVLSNAVCSQFRAAIAVSEETGKINTVQDIADRPDLVVKAVRDSHLEDSIKKSELPHFQLIYKRMLANEQKSLINMRDLPKKETFRSVKDGHSVLVTITTYAQIVLSSMCADLKGNRRLYLIDEEFAPHEYVWIYNKEFPRFLLDILNMRVLVGKEMGIVDFIIFRYGWKYWMCSVQDSQEEIHLGLRVLASVFYCLLCCHVISFVVVLIEIVWYKLRSTQPTLKSREQRNA